MVAWSIYCPFCAARCCCTSVRLTISIIHRNGIGLGRVRHVVRLLSAMLWSPAQQNHNTQQRVVNALDTHTFAIHSATSHHIAYASTIEWHVYAYVNPPQYSGSSTELYHRNKIAYSDYRLAHSRRIKRFYTNAHLIYWIFIKFPHASFSLDLTMPRFLSSVHSYNYFMVALIALGYWHHWW